MKARRSWYRWIGAIAAIAAVGVALAGADAQQRRGGGQGGGKGGAQGRGESNARLPTLAFRTEVPPKPYDLILARPTGDAMTLSALAYQDLTADVAYGVAADRLDQRLPAQHLVAGRPAEFVFTGLRPGTRYYYQFRPESGAPAGPVEEFFTARLPGQPFVFTVQADSHLDFGTELEIYERSLGQVRAARGDFHVDLGDTFMTDKRNDFKAALPQYVAQRYYFGLLEGGTPLLMVLGNHDGEQPGRGGDGPDSMAVWSNGMRRRYFPNPEPNAFYTGNATAHSVAGLLQNYYAFEWGDGLFIALDPYWYSQRRGRDGDNWGTTLGRAQYEWLRRTLAQSRAKVTFVFLHNLVGGETREGRGGAEASRFFEWGGRELDGRDTFAANRAGWEAPIHELLARRGRAVVFHGHDHFYAYQQRDGVVYQLVPQPGHGRFEAPRSAEEYGYKSGVLQGPAGILRVRVAPEETVVEYVRAYAAKAENAERRTGVVSHRYTVEASTAVSGARP